MTDIQDTSASDPPGSADTETGPVTHFCSNCGAPTAGAFCAACGTPVNPVKTPDGAHPGIEIGEIDRAGKLRVSSKGLIIATVIVLVVIGAAIGVWKAISHSTTTYRTINGVVQLTDFGAFLAQSGVSCGGTGGYSDMQPGAGIQVSNQAGTILATGSLGSGTTTGSDGSTCQFTFSIPHVPDAPFYQIEVSHRGNVTFSRSQLEQNDWTAEMSLGGNGN